MPARSALFLGSFLLISACVPVDVWHRTGVTVQKLYTDQTFCEGRALQRAPVRIAVRRTPPVFVPPRHECWTVSGANGQPVEQCRSWPGYWEPGRLVEYDANKSQRTAEMKQCMAGRGYAQVRLPRCHSSQLPASGMPARLSPLTGDSCAAQGVSGRWVALP